MELPTAQGACRGCPQSAVTLQAPSSGNGKARGPSSNWQSPILQESILKTLKHFIPEVRSVRSEEVGFFLGSMALNVHIVERTRSLRTLQILSPSLGLFGVLYGV